MEGKFQGCDGSPFAGIPSWYLTKPPRPTQPGHPSVDGHNECLRYNQHWDTGKMPN